MEAAGVPIADASNGYRYEETHPNYHESPGSSCARRLPIARICWRGRR